MIVPAFSQSYTLWKMLDFAHRKHYCFLFLFFFCGKWLQYKWDKFCLINSHHCVNLKGLKKKKIGQNKDFFLNNQNSFAASVFISCVERLGQLGPSSGLRGHWLNQPGDDGSSLHLAVRRVRVANRQLMNGSLGSLHKLPNNTCLLATNHQR